MTILQRPNRPEGEGRDAVGELVHVELNAGVQLQLLFCSCFSNKKQESFFQSKMFCAPSSRSRRRRHLQESDLRSGSSADATFVVVDVVNVSLVFDVAQTVEIERRPDHRRLVQVDWLIQLWVALLTSILSRQVFVVKPNVPDRQRVLALARRNRRNRRQLLLVPLLRRRRHRLLLLLNRSDLRHRRGYPHPGGRSVRQLDDVGGLDLIGGPSVERLVAGPAAADAAAARRIVKFVAYDRARVVRDLKLRAGKGNDRLTIVTIST